MTPWIPRLLFLQVILCALAAIRGLLPGCHACGTAIQPVDFVVGMCGAVFYFHLWWTASTTKETRFLAICMGGASGLHAGLMIRMAVTGAFCIWCVVAAIGALTLTALLFARHSSPRKLAGLAGSITLASVLATTFARPSPEPTGEPVQVVVYERLDCGYCWDLKQNVLPQIAREFPGWIEVEYRAAYDYKWVRVTPTIVIKQGNQPEIIEGMPSMDYLRGRIAIRIPRPEANR